MDMVVVVVGLLTTFFTGAGAAFVLAKFLLKSRQAGLEVELQQAIMEKERLAAEIAKYEQNLNDSHQRLQTQEVDLARVQAEHSGVINQLAEKNRQLNDVTSTHKETQDRENQLRENMAKAMEAVDKLREQQVQKDLIQNERLDEKNTHITQIRGELAGLQKTYNELNTKHAELNTTLEQKQESFDKQYHQLEQNRESLTKEFERLANEILEKKGQNFKELNRESLQNLLNPIQNEMKGFKEKVESIHLKDSEQRIQLKAEMENLQKLNRDITEKADNLAKALQGQKKTQGNWGELMLENVLDSSGLRLGTDYKREVSFNTEEGRQRPDAIIYLPQEKHMVIDAKTSLAAYTRYVNAQTDEDREQALKEHARAVSDRINELADKNYYQLPGLNSPEVVVMFIPIESAYVEALRYDDTLFQRAIERQVLVATPTTLLTSLNIVRQLWRFEDQNKHTAELASRAEKFYNKLRIFLTSMQDVGKQLDKAKSTYVSALGQLDSGKGNLIKQAAEFKDLGVSVTKELPAEMVERASLELDMPLLDMGSSDRSLQ